MKKSLLLIAAMAATPAAAHIVMTPATATAGGYYAGTLRIGHGCDAAATTAVRVIIPEGVLVARPQPKPGWTVDVERVRLPTPQQVEGKPVTERVAAVTWRGALPAEQFDEFGLMLKLPAAQAGPLYLPVVQSCGAAEARWDQIPAPGAAWASVPHPAPVLDVKPAAESHSH